MNAFTSDRLSRLILKSDRFTLDNGLRVVVHTDRRAPVVAVDVTYLVGSKDEEAGESGLAHLFEHLMFTGTEALPGPFNARLVALGAIDVNAETTNDATSYRNLVPAGMLEFVLYAEADRMGTLGRALTRPSLDLQRAIVLQEKRERDQQPSLRAAKVMMEIAFPADHPYRRTVIGDDADLASTTLEDAQRWFTRFYGPSNAVLTICGDLDVDEVRPMVERYFASIPPGPALKRDMAWIPAATPKRHVRLEEPTAKSASLTFNWVCAGTSDPDIDMLELFFAYIASDDPGQLRDRLVTQDRLVTNIGSGIDRSNLLCCQAFIDVLFDDPSSTTVVDDAVRSFLRRTLEGPMDNTILERVKTARLGYWTQEFRRLESRARVLAFGESRCGNPDSYVLSSQRMVEADAAAVLTVARRWLRSDPAILEVVPFAHVSPKADESDAAAPLTLSAPAIITTSERLVLPRVDQSILSNGLKIVAATGFDCDSTAMRVVSAIGYADERPDRRGLIQMVMGLWLNGAGDRDKAALLEVLRSKSIIVPFGASSTSVAIDFTFALDATDTALDILADLIVAPHFLEANLKSNQELTIKRLRESMSDSVGNAARVSIEQLFGLGSPLTWSSSGTELSVAAIDLETVKACHRSIWDASRTTILCAGGPPLDQLVDFFEKKAGTWPCDRDHLIAPVSLPPPRPAVNNVALIDDAGSDVCWIHAGRLLPSHPDSDLAQLAVSHALGGSVNSRLMHQLREVRGWAYGGGSDIWGLGRPGVDQMLSIDTKVRIEHALETVSEIQDLLDDMAAVAPVTAQERDIFVAAHTRAFHQVLRDPARLVASMQRQLATSSPLGGWEAELDALGNLTVESIRQSAESMLSSRGLSWTMTGDVASIEKQFAMSNLEKTKFSRWDIGTGIA